MDKWEKKISELPWPQPSAELRTRIFQSATTAAVTLHRLSWRWVAVLVMGAGFLGFLLGQQPGLRLKSVSMDNESSLLTLVIESQAGDNSFDMTPRRGTILPNEVIVSSNMP